MRMGVGENNLPGPLSNFVGRVREREEVLEALSVTRLLVLTGAGGSGKTRLAQEVAAAAVPAFPDGAWWIELASVARDDQVAGAVSGVLGVRPLPGRTETQAAADRLAADRALVVLDNCEHVLAGAADLGEALLRGCPCVTVLATSRSPLGIPGEFDWRVPSLSLPSTNDLEDVGGADACSLFADRAMRAVPGFELTNENAAVVRSICQRVDGLPLAIELAAARVRMLSLQEISDGLNDPFRMLTGSQRGALPRHQTLRASVDWSYALLSPPERILFRRLAVFGGSWSLRAVESVCAGDGLGCESILDLLASLIDESMVVVEHHDQSARYRLLETVRQYALEQLQESGEMAVLRDRHLEYFCELAELAGRELHTPRVHEWFTELEFERANLQIAFDHAIESRPESALRMGVALTAWWRFAGQLAVGRRALARALEMAPSASSLRARALWGAGFVAHFAGDPGEAAAYTMQALEMAQSVGDEWTLAMALMTVSGAQMFRDPAGSRGGFERAIALARTVDDPWVLMICSATMGRSYLVADEVGAAERLFAEVEPMIGLVGDEAVTHSGYGLGWCAMMRCDFARSEGLYDQASSAARRLGDPITDALIDRMRAWTELMQGRTEAALARLRASEARAVARGAFMAVPGARTEMGRALAALGHLDEAHDLLAAVVASGADQGWHYCAALVALADVLRALGDADGSGDRASEARDLSDRLGVLSYRASARELMARLAIDSGNWTDADSLLHEALSLRVDIGVPIWLPQTLDALALVAAGLESDVEAARLLGAANQARSDLGLVRWALDAPAASHLEQQLAARLEPDAFERAITEGAGMSLDEAIRWVRRARGERKRPTTGWASLTPTEQRVVELAALGFSNPEIAKRMFISSGTAKVHLAHIFEKLGVHSRVELAALAARHAR